MRRAWRSNIQEILLLAGFSSEAMVDDELGEALPKQGGPQKTLR